MTVAWVVGVLLIWFAGVLMGYGLALFAPGASTRSAWFDD